MKNKLASDIILPSDELMKEHCDYIREFVEATFGVKNFLLIIPKDDRAIFLSNIKNKEMLELIKGETQYLDAADVRV